MTSCEQWCDPVEKGRISEEFWSCARNSNLKLALESVVVYVKRPPFVVQVVLGEMGICARQRRSGSGELTLILRPNFMRGLDGEAGRR